MIIKPLAYKLNLLVKRFMGLNNHNLSKRCSEHLRREIFLKHILFKTINETSVQKALSTLSKLTGQFFEADYCLIIRYDESKEKLLTNLNEYISSSELPDLKNLDLNKYDTSFIENELFGKKNAFFSNDIQNSDFSDDIKKLLEEYKIQSTMSAPLTYQSETYGWISINSRQNKHFSQNDIDTLSVIASHSSFIFYKLKTETQLKNKIEIDATLKKITENCLSCESFEDAIFSIVKDFVNLTNLHRGTFRQYDEEFEIFLNVAGDYHKDGKDMPSIHRSTYSHNFSKYMADYFFQKEITCIQSVKNMPENKPEELELKERALALDLKSFHIISLQNYNKKLGFIMVGNMLEEGKLDSQSIEAIKFILPLIFSSINLFISNKKLHKQAEIEMIVNKLSYKFEQKKGVMYFLKQLFYFFNADITLYLVFDKNENLILQEHFISDSFSRQKKIQEECIKILKPVIQSEKNAVYVNNAIEEIEDKNLTNKFEECNINSFIANGINAFGKAKKTGIFIVLSKKSRTWACDEVNAFEYLTRYYSDKYYEYLQKLELEETRQSFIATLTHDLKSPILATQRAIEAMLIMTEDILAINLKEYLKNIYSNNEEILKIINSMLSVYHYESSAYKLIYEKFDFNRTILSSVELLKHSLINKKCIIKKELDDNLPNICADENELKRVLLNLLSNALKHSKEGSEILIKTSKKNDFIEYSIKNEGKIIAQEDIASIFHKFKSSRRITGAGLGLYLSKQIVEAHKGYIWAQSQEDLGTTFYFRIPIKKPKE